MEVEHAVPYTKLLQYLMSQLQVLSCRVLMVPSLQARTLPTPLMSNETKSPLPFPQTSESKKGAKPKPERQKSRYRAVSCLRAYIVNASVLLKAFLQSKIAHPPSPTRDRRRRDGVPRSVLV